MTDHITRSYGVFAQGLCNTARYSVANTPRKPSRPRMKISEASEALERIGLSRYEALVFVNLARAGATTAGDVARASGVNRVQTYRALEGLEARGLVEGTLDRPRRDAARAINEGFDIIAGGKRAELEKLDAGRKTVLEARPQLSGH